MNKPGAEQQIIMIVENIQKIGSISATADVLFMSQPAISKIISRQESQLNVELIDHSRHPLNLTPSGVYYLRYIKKLVRSYQTLTQNLLLISKTVIGKMKIGINPSLAQWLLPLFLPQFHINYPEVKLEVIEHESNEMEHSIDSGRIDIYIGINPPLFNNLCYNSILTVGGAVAISNVLIEKEYGSIPKAKIENVAPIINNIGLITESDGSGFQRVVNSYFTRYQIKPNVVLTVNNIATAINLVNAGLGVTIVPDSFAKRRPLSEGKSYVYIDPRTFQCEIKIVYNQKIPLSEVARLLIDHTIETFNTVPSLDFHKPLDRG